MGRYLQAGIEIVKERLNGETLRREPLHAHT